METLRTRAAKFAALAEPARLRIVDMLTLGDLSPTEVQSALGMASNLVAHHLRVLENAGVITRTRSEFDGRRSYIRLVPNAFDRLAPEPLVAPRRVVFVCTANSARSQIAAALWHARMDIPVASAGTQPAEAVNEAAVRAAARRGVRIPATRPRSVDSVVRDDDFVVAVCDRAHEELAGINDLHWSVPDPAKTGTDDAFDAAVAELDFRVRDFSSRILTAAS
jgi:protein-tyrosine-phosphatase